MADSTDAGACKKTHPAACFSLYKGDFVMLKGHPCRIVEKSTSKTDAKMHFAGIDIFTGKKYEDTCPFTHNMDVPFVKKTNYTVSGGVSLEAYVYIRVTFRETIM